MKNWYILLPALFTLIGCYGSSMPMQTTHKARGKVTVNGKSYAGLTLVLHPEDKTQFKWDERPQARTNEQGEFELFTYQAGDGAPAGKYRVGFAFIETDDSGNDQIKTKGLFSLIPAQFQSPTTSGVVMEIKPGDNVIPPVDLKYQVE